MENVHFISIPVPKFEDIVRSQDQFKDKNCIKIRWQMEKKHIDKHFAKTHALKSD